MRALSLSAVGRRTAVVAVVDEADGAEDAVEAARLLRLPTTAPRSARA